MAISFVGIADAAAATVALPAFNADDVAFVFAFRDGSTTPPTLPAGWTNIDNAGANTSSFRCGYRQLVGGDTDTGTWTNATEIEVVVLRAVDLGYPFGVINSGTGASTSMNWPALGTFTNPNGGSWVLLLGGHRTATDVNSVALSGTTNRSPGTTALGAHTKENTSSWASTSKTVNANSGWHTIALEVLFDGGAFRRISQAPVESVLTSGDVQARISQAPAESVVTAGDVKARVTQAVVEVTGGFQNVAAISQLPVEVVSEFTAVQTTFRAVLIY